MKELVRFPTFWFSVAWVMASYTYLYLAIN